MNKFCEALYISNKAYSQDIILVYWSFIPCGVTLETKRMPISCLTYPEQRSGPLNNNRFKDLNPGSAQLSTNSSACFGKVPYSILLRVRMNIHVHLF